MKLHSKHLLLLGVFLSFAACQKKDNTPPDPTKVTFTISSPFASHVYHTGDTVQMNADFAYIAEMHGVAVTITDSATGEELFEADQDLHTDHFSWQQSWVNTLTEPAILKVKFIAFITDDAQEADKTITIKSQP